jgi:8-oxo-dGTP pyrophosphatase MutT (NUDIX family)
MYKVFIENKPVIFTSEVINENFYTLNTGSHEEIKQALNTIHSIPNEGINILTETPDSMFQHVFETHKKVLAAGGVVFKNRSVLLIKRLGYWDLPKGKLEKDENSEIGALREVEEECGIKGHVLNQFLSTTYHTYEMKGVDYLKATDWYLMDYKGDELLIPQTDEGITEALWLEISDLSSYHNKMYLSLLDVLAKAEDLVMRKFNY